MSIVNDDAGKAKAESTEAKGKSRLLILSLAALGVVFGDIATSPIYAIRECFHGEYGIEISHANVMGILSLMFWAMVMIVGLKYLIFVFRADNRGEGGVIALTALVRGIRRASETRRGLGVIALGLFAACLLYGDGMITPAISVLSAVEGLAIITPAFDHYVIPITIAILLALFLIQRHGTATIGGLFGPVILIWLCFLALTGLIQVVRAPQVLAALFPWYGVQFLILNKMHGFVVLGAVFLVVTGAEALYADMGHFGVHPIRLTWFGIVFPALVLNYFGQGALLLGHPEVVSHPFYAMVPSWAMIPTVVLTTLATIIASQAVISGAFSLTTQAIQLGYLPRLHVRHTSAKQIGQIYVAPVNWMLMLCTVALVAGFQSSSKLAAAYGVAVTSTMIITSILFFVVARHRWQWPLMGLVPLTGLFLLVDIPFFLANISKIFHGAWFPLVIGSAFFILMLTWAKGRRIVGEQLRTVMQPVHQLVVELCQPPGGKNSRGRRLFNRKSKCGSRGPGQEPQALQSHSQPDDSVEFFDRRYSPGTQSGKNPSRKTGWWIAPHRRPFRVHGRSQAGQRAGLGAGPGSGPGSGGNEFLYRPGKPVVYRRFQDDALAGGALYFHVP